MGAAGGSNASGSFGMQQQQGQQQQYGMRGQQGGMGMGSITEEDALLGNTGGIGPNASADAYVPPLSSLRPPPASSTSFSPPDLPATVLLVPIVSACCVSVHCFTAGLPALSSARLVSSLMCAWLCTCFAVRSCVCTRSSGALTRWSLAWRWRLHRSNGWWHSSHQMRTRNDRCDSSWTVSNVHTHTHTHADLYQRSNIAAAVCHHQQCKTTLLSSLLCFFFCFLLLSSLLSQLLLISHSRCSHCLCSVDEDNDEVEYQPVRIAGVSSSVLPDFFRDTINFNSGQTPALFQQALAAILHK